MRALAWTLGLAGAVACTLTLGLTIAIGLASEELLVLPTFILAGLLGALVASREPRNSVGWLMCAASLAAVLLYIPTDYGYAAGVIEHGAWPLAGQAFWVGAWAWVPVLSLFLPAITARFPDGIVPSQWRAVEWLAMAGTAATALGAALSPPDLLVRFLLLPRPKLAVVEPIITNPLAGFAPVAMPGIVLFIGLGLVLLAYLASLGSVVDRFRHARSEERLQLKWFAYAVGLIATAVVYGAAVELIGVVPPGAIDVALHLSFLSLPLAIGIAILRYRLYEIDVIINRSVVYLTLTAILGALYTAVITFLNRLFISASGQKSDAAYVLTAFVVVVAFGPVKDALQRRVDRRLGRAWASDALDSFSAGVDAVVSVLDVHRIACRLVDQAVLAFDAYGAELYLRSADGSLYCRGEMHGEVSIEVVLRHEGTDFGRLVMGRRRGDAAYTRRDREALQRSADSVGEALALAAHFGHQPMTKTSNR